MAMAQVIGGADAPVWPLAQHPAVFPRLFGIAWFVVDCEVWGHAEPKP